MVYGGNPGAVPLQPLAASASISPGGAHGEAGGYGPGLLDEEELGESHEDEAPEPMDEEDLEAYLRAEIDMAISVQHTLGGRREELTRRYLGEPYGDEEEGRSRAVSRDFRDVVNAIMPSLMRIFWGPERVAEFSPRGPEDVALAEQMTDAVDFVLKVDNPGFLVLHAAFKDALIRDMGIIQWRWDDSVDVSEERYEGLTPEAAQMLAQEAALAGGSVQPTPRPDGLVDVVARHYRGKGRVVVESVPPEELLIEATARSVDSARFVARKCYKSVSDLVAMGYDREEVEEYAGTSEWDEMSIEARKRIPAYGEPISTPADEANRPVMYVEAYARVDYDGDGVAELRHICAIGESHEIFRNEPIDQRPIAVFCADPEPHTVFGNGLGDILTDIQRIKTSLLRAMLNSLALTTDPRLVVVDSQVEMADVLNTDVGAIIRSRQPGMVQPLTVPFVGREVLDVLAVMDSIKQDRTGISKAAAGLDADALQSTTKAAVAATVSAAHQHIEMIARVLAETGLKPAMRGVAKLMARHQDQARMMRLRGRWVPVSPAAWNVDADVVINVAVGAGTMQERVATLLQVAQRQEGILQQYGPVNPLVTVSQYRNTLAKILEMSGFRDPSQFFQEVPPDWQPPQQQPKQTPEELLAQVQMEQIRADIAIKQQEMALKERELRMRDDRERDKNEADVILRAREIELKYAGAVDVAGIKAGMDAQRVETQFAPPPPPPPAPAAPQQEAQVV